MGDKAFETGQCKGGNYSCSEGTQFAFKKNLENGFLLANRCLTGGLILRSSGGQQLGAFKSY